jgi:hypothetical protein
VLSLVDEVDVDVDTVATGSSTHDGADALGRATAASDDPTEVARADAHLEVDLLVFLTGVDVDGVGVVDDGTNDVLQDRRCRGCRNEIGAVAHLALLEAVYCSRAGDLEKLADTVGGLGALLQPSDGLVVVDVEVGGLGARVVLTEDLDEAAIAGTTLVGNDDAVVGLLGLSDASETQLD